MKKLPYLVWQNRMVKHWEREATFVLPFYFVIQKGGYKDMASIEKFVDAAVVNQLRH